MTEYQKLQNRLEHKKNMLSRLKLIQNPNEETKLDIKIYEDDIRVLEQKLRNIREKEDANF